MSGPTSQIIALLKLVRALVVQCGRVEVELPSEGSDREALYSMIPSLCVLGLVASVRGNVMILEAK